MEFYFFVGVVAIYSVSHFLLGIQKKAWESRTEYEKVVTWVACICIFLVFIGVMSE